MPGRNDFDNENVNYPEGKQKRVAWPRVDIETTVDEDHEEDRFTDESWRGSWLFGGYQKKDS